MEFSNEGVRSKNQGVMGKRLDSEGVRSGYVFLVVEWTFDPGL